MIAHCIPLAVSVAAVVGLLIWQLVRYVKVAELVVKRKLLRNIALIMLIPIAVFFVTYVVIAKIVSTNKITYIKKESSYD